MNDLISRVELLDAMPKNDELLSIDVRRVICAAPAVNAVPVVQGRWIRCDGKSIVWYCSECGGKILYNPNPRTYNIKKPKVEQYNKFCRNCGAKMDIKEARNEENPDPVCTEV